MYLRIIAFDVGDKWIGVAHTDLLQTMAIPLSTWQVDSFKKEFSLYLTKNNLEKAIVGLPLTLSGGQSEQTKKIESWLIERKIEFPQISFFFQDERLSSQFAKRIMQQNKQKSNHSDHSIAASIMLENFLLYTKK